MKLSKEKASVYLTPPSVTLMRRISSGERIPNWTLTTFLTGAFESLVLMADMMPPTKDPLLSEKMIF